MAWEALSEWVAMVFDIVSFLAGVLAGAVTGALAGILHGLESTADLQERLRQVTKEVEKMKTAIGSQTPSHDSRNTSSEIDRLSHDLNEIHEEIRRLYKKGKR
jgi:gas vesicle protein